MGILNKLVGGAAAQPIEAVGNIVKTVFGDAGEKMSHEEFMAKLAMQPGIAQVELNKVEAGHRSLFVAGWRPALGWVAAISLAIYYIPQYTMATVLWVKISWAAQEIAPYPATTAGLMELVVGMLGLGGLRTIEKVTGRAK